MLLAVLNQRVAFIIESEPIVRDRSANAILLCESGDETSLTMLRKVVGVKIGDALTTDLSSQNVLMHVNQSVNASVAELIDQHLDFIEISHVESVRGPLDGLPHHA
jgi:hypothetical protein